MGPVTDGRFTEKKPLLYKFQSEARYVRREYNQTY